MLKHQEPGGLKDDGDHHLFTKQNTKKKRGLPFQFCGLADFGKTKSRSWIRATPTRAFTQRSNEMLVIRFKLSEKDISLVICNGMYVYGVYATVRGMFSGCYCFVFFEALDTAPPPPLRQQGFGGVPPCLPLHLLLASHRSCVPTHRCSLFGYVRTPIQVELLSRLHTTCVDILTVVVILLAAWRLEMVMFLCFDRFVHNLSKFRLCF